MAACPRDEVKEGWVGRGVGASPVLWSEGGAGQGGQWWWWCQRRRFLSLTPMHFLVLFIYYTHIYAMVLMSSR